MKSALTLLAMLALVGSAVASVPDPDYCTVDPMDQMDVPRLVGIPHEPIPPLDDATCIDAAELDVHVAAFGGDVIVNAFVEVVFNGLCDDLCICDSYVGSGYTDTNGDITICCRFGGCCEEPSAAIILAEGIGIRAVDYVVSPDYDGEAGNCQVNLADFIYFGTFWGQVGGVTCADYSGDGDCNLADFIVFGAGWGQSCVPE